ncbi:MAG: diguanylate cyclase [Synergistaceae bacterium]|nr:diguanylate cyclase [Synergistaceae bacterium]
MAMNNSTINIYVTGKNLAGILSEVSPPSGMLCRVETLDAGIRINAQAMNVFILKKLPSRILDGAKYIICSKSYNEMTADELNALYDLWPEPLTPSLLKFYYRKLLERIQSEQLNTSEEIEHQKRIIEMARQDYLTGLATRWYLQEYIKKNQDEQNVTCVYLDLDNFKKVNDTYGHQAGDRALVATAEMMQRDFTDGFCARMGGDEFMIVLLGLREASDVEKKVNVFMAGLLEYYAGTKTMRALSVSAGIAQKTHGDSKTIDRLIHESDIALYEAKKSGRACCRVYNASMEEQREEEESVKSYYLVDYENVKSEGLNGIHKLDGNNTVCIFYSRNADRISSELNLHLKESNAEIIYRHVEVGMRNALDFQLSSYLGEVITENAGKNCKYYIVSKDNGFSSLIPFWRDKNIDIKIVADVSGTEVRSNREETADKVIELTGDSENASKIADIIMSCRTRTEVNSALQRLYRDNDKSSSAFHNLKPLIEHKPGR